MSLPVVTDLTEPPVVGQWYLVPCVLYWYDYRLRWWPVIGPRHEDADHLAFPAAHYHFDRRFLPARMFSSWESKIHPRDLGETRLRHPDTWIAARPLQELAVKPHPDDGRDYGGPLPQPVLRRRKCIIADAGFPAVEEGGPRFESFHAAYEGKRCGRDADGHLICPHKGARLSSLAADRNGVVTCPLHGLAVNVRTGAVVKRARAGGSVTR